MRWSVATKKLQGCGGLRRGVDCIPSVESSKSYAEQDLDLEREQVVYLFVHLRTAPRQEHLRETRFDLPPLERPKYGHDGKH